MPREPSRPPLNLRSAPTVRTTPTRHSKRVTARIQAAGALRGAIKAHGERVAAGFGRRVAAQLRDGEAAPDPTLMLDLLGREVMAARAALVEADNAYCSAGTRRQTLNKACDQVARVEVFPQLRDLRADLDTMFGRYQARRLHGMKGATLRKPKRLFSQLEPLVLELRQRRALPMPRRPGVVIDRAGCLERVEPGYRKLKAMLAELEEREIVEARRREDRDFELESFDVVYHEALALVCSVFRLAGLGEKVIWRLRPYGGRRHLRGKARLESEARADGKRSRRSASEVPTRRDQGPATVA